MASTYSLVYKLIVNKGNKPMNAKDCIFFQLAKASQAGTRFWTKRVVGSGVTAVQAMVMNFLYDEDQITAAELGKRTMLDSATLTGVLDRMEASDLLERRQHPDDRRAVLVCLTPDGRIKASDLRLLAMEANREFLDELSDAETSMLRSLLLRLRKNAEIGMQAALST
jgi:DNA-binding MarR family transcriptional regulator